MSDLKTNIKPGDLVIINNFDTPEGRLICIITSIVKSGDKIKYFAKYISREMKKKYHDRHIDTFFRDCFLLDKGPTKIEDFGVRLILNNFPTATVKIIQESSATYEDGRPRKWQGFDNETFKIRSDYQKILNEIIL